VTRGRLQRDIPQPKVLERDGPAPKGARGLPAASRLKLQAPSSESHKQQASSDKHKGSSAKPQASSSLIMEPGKSFTDL